MVELVYPNGRSNRSRSYWLPGVWAETSHSWWNDQYEALSYALRQNIGQFEINGQRFRQLHGMLYIEEADGNILSINLNHITATYDEIARLGTKPSPKQKENVNWHKEGF